MYNDKPKKIGNIKLKSLCLMNSNANSTFNTNIHKSCESDINNKEVNVEDKIFHKKDMFNLSKTDDSLVEFMSPKKKKNEKLILNQFKIDNNKTKKKVVKPTSKFNTKTIKKSFEMDQSLIESSFFKPQTSHQNESIKSLPCPLCLKPFKDEITCTNHMKTCATKNKISTRQLFKAKQLQDRQIEERKAMGLLPTPVLPEKKKVFRSKNFSTEDDPQLQLALAVSESLYHAKQKMELEEAALLAGIPSNFVKEIADEEHRATLQKFGFTTNKPVTDLPSNRFKKKKLLGPTVLQTRSKEEKDRVLTERIACILTGDDAFTQQPKKNTEIDQELKLPTILKNKSLRDIEQMNNKLWDKSKLTETCDFYVEELKSHFLPQENEKIKFSDNVFPHDKNNEDSIETNATPNETMDVEVVYDKNEEQNNSFLPINNKNNLHWEFSYTNNIIFDWKKGINDSTLSDIIIFVKNNKYIYAHKLVFYIRQSNILLDIEPNDTDIDPQIQNKLCLLENDELPTLAYLEYIYCGNIENNISVFYDDNLLCQVKNLGILYPVKDLIEYLEKKRKAYLFRKLKDSKNLINENNINSYISNENNNQISIVTPIKKSNISSIKNSNSFKIQIEAINSTPKSNSPLTLHIPIINDNILKNLNKKNDSEREFTASPDLFESENEDDKIFSCDTQKDNKIFLDHTSSNKITNDINTKYTKASENKKNSNEIMHTSSEIIEILSPEKNYLSEEDIYRAVTPKKSSSKNNFIDNLNNSIILKEIEPYIDDISVAITPESHTLSRLDDYITPKKAIYTNIGINDISPDETIKNDNSIYTITTPKKSESNKKHDHKLKSNLSKFIDKVQRKNAKSVFETDSETDISEHIEVRRKNRFLQTNAQDSYSYLLNNKNKIQFKTNISLIENAVLKEGKAKSEVKKYSMSTGVTTLSNNNNIQKISTDKFSNSDLNLNSHDKYIEVNNSKKIQNFNDKSSYTKLHNGKLSCSETWKLNEHKKHEKSKNVSTSDYELKSSISEEESYLTSESQLSRYSRYKRANKDNSIAKYRKELELNNFFSNDSKSILPESNVVKTTNPVYDNINLISDCDGDEIEKNLQSSIKFTNKHATLLEHLKNTNPKKSSQEIMNLSPISIISSPEICKLNKDNAVDKKRKFKILLDSFKEKKIDESYLIKYFNENINEQNITKSPLRKENDKNQNNSNKFTTNPNSSNRKTIFEDIFVENNSQKLYLSSHPFISSKSCVSELISSPILSQSSKMNYFQFSNSSPKQTYQNEISTKLLNKARKLKTKSVSTSFITPGNNKLLENFSKHEESVTPPIDYNLLNTPDLRKELNKYGLKYYKRNKATLLLNHIYKETHPLVALTQKRTSTYNSSSDDEESVSQKQNSKKKFKRNTNTESRIQNLQDCSTAAAEIDFNQYNIANKSEKSINIKDTFYRIIEDNKEIYTKILTYMPLPLEPLHLMLKVNGCKCKLNDLENFLDEQCITFQSTKQNDKKLDKISWIK